MDWIRIIIYARTIQVFLKTIKCEQSGTPDEYERLKVFLNKMDIRRNLECRDVFPEMTEFWNIVQGISAEEWKQLQEIGYDG